MSFESARMLRSDAYRGYLRNRDLFQEVLCDVASVQASCVRSRCESMTDHTGQHGLNVFRNHVRASGYQRPCARGVEQTKRRARRQAARVFS